MTQNFCPVYTGRSFYMSAESHLRKESRCYNFGMLKEHYENVKKTIGNAELCVVTKKRSEEEILSYYRAGERVFGENHAGELTAKAENLPQDIQWQFIGHLQTNKVRQIFPYVSRIQSLDSLKLAETIEKECVRNNRNMNCLTEFHLAEEDTNKSGIPIEEADSFLHACLQYPHLKIEGIMVMGPHTDDSERIKFVFMKAKKLYHSLKDAFPQMPIHILSMGMSADYQIAVECGSNMVRVGTYLFEK